jgi:peptide-methionine (R)-S-oxide reductase
MAEDKGKVTNDEWKSRLTPEQYKVLREKGTEMPFSGKYVNTHDAGMFKCAACGNQLFSSTAKFDSGTGWPSFDQALPGAVKYEHDAKYGMDRTEVLCTNCGSHLGHVFDDGPKATTGKRFCINSVCLELEKKK